MARTLGVVDEASAIYEDIEVGCNADNEIAAGQLFASGLRHAFKPEFPDEMFDPRNMRIGDD